MRVRTHCTRNFWLQFNSRTRARKHSSPLVTCPGRLLSFRMLDPDCFLRLVALDPVRVLITPANIQRSSIAESSRHLISGIFSLTASGAYETHAGYLAGTFIRHHNLISSRSAALCFPGSVLATLFGSRLTSFLAGVHLLSHSGRHMKRSCSLPPVECVSYCISPVLPIPRRNLRMACHAWTWAGSGVIVFDTFPSST